MEPALAAGDQVLLVPSWWPRPGQVVAFSDPRLPSRLLLKRVVTVDRRRGRLVVAGDNPAASTDSRAFGPIARRDVVGRAVYRYAPPGRAGPIRRGG